MLSYWDILVMIRTKKSIEILQTVLYASYLMNCCHCYNFISSINVNIWQSQCNIVFADPVIWIWVWAVRLNWNYRKWQAGCTTLSRRGLWVPKGKMFHNHLIIGPADFNQFFRGKKALGLWWEMYFCIYFIWLMEMTVKFTHCSYCTEMFF